MRSITVISNDINTKITYNPADGKPLSHILRDNHIIINTACGGHGICRKCIVSVKENSLPFYKDAYACKYIPKTDLTVNIAKSRQTTPNSIENNHFYPDSFLHTGNICSNTAAKPGSVIAAIDLGSTSITIGIYNNYDVIRELTIPNPTICYGADIISRVGASAGGNTANIMNMLKDGLYRKLTHLLNICHINPDTLNLVVISCNNAMQHLLLGLDIGNSFAYPFASLHTSFDNFHYADFFKLQIENDSSAYSCHATVCLVDSFSTFIGGDILSGLYFIDALSIDEPFLFIDLGTNAEMVIGNKDRMLAASAAAGPAFEACGLSCGTAYASGAICDAIFTGKTLRCKTVNDTIPSGICGSGVLYLLSALIRKGIIDITGTLADEYTDAGFLIAKSLHGDIILSQSDIRKIQLAIAAIRSGISILLSTYNITPDEIKHVFISGSFGSSLDFKRLDNLHILKKPWIDKNIIKTCGNTSLMGALKYANNTNNSVSYIQALKAGISELALSEHTDFNNIFLSEMDF